MKPSRIVSFEVVAVLSGLEPQRTMLEEEIVNRYVGRAERVLIVEGMPSKPMLQVSKENITIVPYLGDTQLMAVLQQAQRIIARSGYSTIMDLAALHLLDKAELIATPGQPEQEYLQEWIQNRNYKTAK